jgi:protein-S-isoprenylcysteine O-methyltransferase Ste14
MRVPPLAATVVTAVLMWVAARALPALRMEFVGQIVLGLLLAGIGLVISIAGVTTFRRARTTTNPLRPEAASALVTGGIYARTRNPMYLGFACGLAGWAVLLAHPVAFLGVPAFIAWMNSRQIPDEERALRAAFGSRFSDYCGRVRRWL